MTKNTKAFKVYKEKTFVEQNNNEFFNKMIKTMIGTAIIVFAVWAFFG